MPENGDWSHYRRLVLTNLERAEHELVKLREDVASVKGRIGSLESRSFDEHISKMEDALEEVQRHLATTRHQQYVTRDEFAPISKLVWAVVLSTTTLIVGAIGALLARGLPSGLGGP